MEELLPEFINLKLTDVNQHGHFGDTPLHVACIRGYEDEVDALLEGGANINSKGEHDNLPIHYAVAQGHILIVKKLLNYGASIDSNNSFGDTPIDIAKMKEFNEIFSLLNQR